MCGQVCSGKMSPVCYRRCSSGQCELRKSERLGCGQSRSSLLQSWNPTSEPEHDATGLDSNRTTCTGNRETLDPHRTTCTGNREDPHTVEPRLQVTMKLRICVESPVQVTETIHIEPRLQVTGKLRIQIPVQVTVTSCLCSQSECNWSVFRRVLTIVFSGHWTTEEVSSSELDSVMRCLWGQTGSWYQVHSCPSDQHTCLSDLYTCSVRTLSHVLRSSWLSCVDMDSL